MFFGLFQPSHLNVAGVFEVRNVWLNIQKGSLIEYVHLGNMDEIMFDADNFH